MSKDLQENSEIRKVPTLNEVIELVINSFKSQEWEMDGGLRVPHTILSAAYVVTEKLIQEGTDVKELMLNILNNTSLQPEQINGFEIIGEATTWEEFFLDVSRKIVEAETAIQHPQLIEENNNRRESFPD